MRETPQGQGTTVQLAPQAPAAPAPGGAGQGGGAAVAGGGGGGGAGTPTTGVDLAKYSVTQLRRMLSELRNQRQELADRRSSIGDVFERSTGDNRASLTTRINTLDNNIVQYEMEISRVGREIAARGGGTTTEPSTGSPPPGWMPEEDAAGMAFGFSFMTLLLTLFFARRYFRKRYGAVPAGRHQQQPNLIASNERLDRIEQAVDTIAVEIERVSENQRFMTRLMTETQLGETIKDVRKSADLAKSAAENG